ncbi:MAG: hypothetical protein RLZZ373_2735 [Pseudomonadota bacterium]
MTIERDVKAQLRALLKEIGAYQYWPVPRGLGAATVDVLFCYKGKFYGVETKRPDVKKSSARQACVLRDIASAGGGIAVENSVGLETVRKMLGL